jgi:hypothetical protein
MPIPFVGKRYTPKQFEELLKETKFAAFRPEFVVLHHTANPSLAQRPDGFSDQHLQNLLHYYQNMMGWSGAPHIFIDDREDGIIVFQRLNARGVHAASFNSIAWGIEMLGYYDSEPFDSGRGAKVRDMAMRCLALMCQRLKVGAETIRFHRDDPTTNKTCPGLLVQKIDVVQRVASLMKKPLVSDVGKSDKDEWEVFLRNGVEILPVHIKDGRPMVRIRDFVNQLKPGGTFKAGAKATEVKWLDKQKKVHVIRIAQIDEKGAGWGFIRDVCDAIGFQMKVSGKRIEILT